MHPKEESQVSTIPQVDLNVLVARVKEALEASPESLAKVEEIQVSLTRLDVTIIPKR
jgi:hypothetical protein